VEFCRGKRSRKDVQEFEWRLEENIFALQRELASGSYRHGPYSAFTICDPKQRPIHKALVRDRIVHHALFKILNPIFESSFISHSFSCRAGKGTHRAVDMLERTLWRESRNHTRLCHVLKCDIHHFFASVDHEKLLSILGRRINDERTTELLREIVSSFVAEEPTLFERKGIPIGNLTSQLFANVYLNEFDQFMKHTLRVQCFIRYTDDFVIVSEDENYLCNLLPSIQSFLKEKLSLDLHPHKVTIRKYGQGIDFLGYVLLPHHRMIRTRTRRRMFRKLFERVGAYKAGVVSAEGVEHSLQSYLGVLSHANAHDVSEDLRNQYWFCMCA